MQFCPLEFSRRNMIIYPEPITNVIMIYSSCTIVSPMRSGKKNPIHHHHPTSILGVELSRNPKE
jgi:hypothetical protein